MSIILSRAVQEKMRFLLIINVCLLLVSDIASAEDKYTTRYDNIDFGEIIASDRLLKNYINCLLDKGKCTPDAMELKRVLPEALATDCVKCSETQKSGVKRVIQHLIRNRRQWWNDLEAKYDPDHKYWDKYKREWEEEGIVLH